MNDDLQERFARYQEAKRVHAEAMGKRDELLRMVELAERAEIDARLALREAADALLDLDPEMAR
jgi:hypothetical protein